jgi:hypothetical protein
MGFLPLFVIPAKAGIQEICASLDSRLRGNDVRKAFSDSLLAVSIREGDGEENRYSSRRS